MEGFCTGMCPDYQLRSRTQHANENSLEVIDPRGLGRGIDQLATKKFERNVSYHDSFFTQLSDRISGICVPAYKQVHLN